MATNLLDNLKSDYKSAEILKNDNDKMVSKWLDIYNSAPYGNEVAHKSQYVSSMVKQMVNWQVPSIVEPFTSSEDIITCEPVTYDDREAARQSELLLNYQFCRNFDRFSFITDFVIKTITEGTCFAKTSWEFEEKEVTEMQEKQVPIPMDPMQEQILLEQLQQAMNQAVAAGQDPEEVKSQFMQQVPTQTVTEEVTYMKKVRNRPTAEICEMVDLRIDPTCRGNINKAQFIIHDWETDLSSLKKDGRYKNLDELKNQLERDETYTNRENVDSSFEFEDEARKRFIVHEYWGNYDLNDDGIAEPVVMCWVGDTLIREDENPLEDGRLPFVRAVYDKKPGYIYGLPLAELIGDKQRIDSVINRGIFDDMKAANNGQRGYKKGFTDDINAALFKKGKDFEFNTTMNDVWEGKYTSLNNSIFGVLEKNKNEADAMSGIKSFAHGTGGNALGSTAAAVNATTTSSAKREMQIIRGIAEDAIIPMLSIWNAYNALFLDEEEVIRITGGFETIRRDDLDGNIDIKMSVATQESKAMKADRLAFLMQTMGNTLPPDQTKVIMSDLLEQNDMPSLAKALMEMPPPEPDPMQQEIARLQVELLTAQVQNEYAKARENEIDYELKSAKTKNELAKARLSGSDADLKDMQFLMEDEGINHQREMEKKNFDAGAKMNEVSVKEASKLTQEREMAQRGVKNTK